MTRKNDSGLEDDDRVRDQQWSDAPTELRDNPFGDGNSEPPTLIGPNPGFLDDDDDPPTVVRTSPDIADEIPLADSDLLVSEDTGMGHALEEDVPTMDLPVAMDAAGPSDAPPPFDPKPIGMFGRYQLLGRLAMGGMAEIFLARESADRHVSRYIVIKRIRSTVADDNEFVSMFLNEARLAMHLRHPNICHLYEFGFETGHHFLAMEYVDGATLHKIARKAIQTGGLPVALAVKIISQVAGALAYAHSAKDNRRQPLHIVHRDVSPHNVMVGYDGVVKLLDFGVAKASTQDVLTMAGVVRGKFAYMSPQQCVGEKLDGRSDIFSLGIVLYEILTGQRLYRRENQFETMRAVVDDPVPSIRAINPRLPAELDRIVQKALQKDPNDRYATSDLLQEDLDHFLAERREVVSTARVAAYMEDLFREEIRRGPEIDQDVEFDASLPSVPLDLQAHSATDRDLAKVDTDRKSRKAIPQTTMRMPTRPGRRFNMEWVWLGVAVVAIFATLAIVASRMWGGGSGTTTVERNPTSQPGDKNPPPTGDPIGTVRVEGPAEAIVWLDGKEMGPPPMTIPRMVLGEHTVEVSRQGFKRFSQRVNLTDSTMMTVRATLDPDIVEGSITVQGSPVGAVVRLDSKQICTLPCATRKVPAGKHELEVNAPGYQAHREDITIEKDALGSFAVDLDKFKPVVMGMINLNTVPWSKVTANGKPLGTTPLQERVRAGSVKLVMTDGQGRRMTKTVTVPANKTTQFFYRFE
ncbi:MAG: serine/threonine-protein kinase [Polyangiales bacterium]|nr:serine/threonine protein kinase [Myxococcales bacterium]